MEMRSGKLFSFFSFFLKYDELGVYDEHFMHLIYMFIVYAVNFILVNFNKILV
jgi:hypothetical protein